MGVVCIPLKVFMNESQPIEQWWPVATTPDCMNATGDLRISVSLTVQHAINLNPGDSDACLSTDRFDKDLVELVLRVSRHKSLAMLLGCGLFDKTSFFWAVLAPLGSDKYLNDHCWYHDEKALPSWLQRARWAADIASGLAQLHEFGLAHWQLRSTNILCSSILPNMRKDKGADHLPKFSRARITDALSYLSLVGSQTAVDIATRSLGTMAFKNVKHPSARCSAGCSLSERQLLSLRNHRIAFLWLAPELLIATTERNGRQQHRSGQAADIYALGVIASELLMLKMPWNCTPATVAVKFTIIANVMMGIHPQIKLNAQIERKITETAFVKLMKQCWRYNPDARPSGKFAARRFNRILENIRLKENLNQRKCRHQPALTVNAGSKQSEGRHVFPNTVGMPAREASDGVIRHQSKKLLCGRLSDDKA